MDNFNSLNVERIPKELKLILKIINENSNLHNIQEEFFRNINWDLFLKLAIHHRIYPLLFLKFKEIRSSLVPSYIINAITEHYKINTFQMLHLTAEIDQICKLFAEQEIPTISLKGPTLAKRLYGDVSLRTSTDIDLLVPISLLKEAEELVVKLGYEKKYDIDTVLNDWTWRHYNVIYIHPIKKTKLEIHWRLHPGPGKEPSFDELWSRRKTSTLTSLPIFYLSTEDLFLYLVYHGARHGWSRLRWLMDINQVISQDLDLDQVQKLLKSYQNIEVVGQAIILAKELLNTKISPRLRELNGKKSGELAQQAIFYLEDLVNIHAESLPENISQYHERHLYSLMSTKQKVLFKLSFLYPYPLDAKTLPLPKSLHFLYFPLRPFLCIWRRSKGHALS